MNISDRLAIMDEIARKNNAEWDKFKWKRQPKPCNLHPLAEWALACSVTFFTVIIMGIVAIISA